jgi:cytochrome P450
LRSRIGEKIEYFDRLYAPHSEQWRAMPGKHFDLLRERRAAIDFLADELMNEKIALFSEILKLTTGTEELARYTARADLIGLLFASHENSAASAAWLIWNLATNADWQEHVANEVSTNSQNGSGITSIKSNWSRLWNSLQETLRLHPPVWSLGRVVQSDIRLGDVQFNAGNTLIISPWLQHRHPAFWNHPDAFDSARFEQKPNPGKGAFLPFGGGIHGCPAEAFARLSICAVIAHWLRSWRFRAIRSRPSPQTVLGLTQQPDEGIWVRLESPRKQ